MYKYPRTITTVGEMPISREFTDKSLATHSEECARTLWEQLNNTITTSTEKIQIGSKINHLYN